MPLALADHDVVLMTPVSLVGEIDQDSADSVIWALREIDGPALLQIDSLGGCARASRRICRTIERHDVHGSIAPGAQAASGAALCWLSCRSRGMDYRSHVKFHYSRLVNFSVDVADAAFLRSLVDDLDQIDAWMRSLILARSNFHDENEVHEFLLSDRALDRDAARALGFWG